MCQLLQHDVTYVFSQECEREFKLLKQALISASMVKTPDWTNPFDTSIENIYNDGYETHIMTVAHPLLGSV